MAVNIISQPNTNEWEFNTIGQETNCIEWKVKSDEFITTQGSQPHIRLTIDDDPQTLGNTMTFGDASTGQYQFTVVDTEDYSPTTVNLTASDAETNVTNLKNAILSNYEFCNKVTVEVFPNGSFFDILITWNDFFYIGFIIYSPVLANPYTSVSSNTGVPSVFQDGFKIAYQLHLDNGTGSSALSSFRSVEPHISSDIVELNTRLNFTEMIANQVFTNEPFSNGFFAFDPDFWKRFFLKYGSQVTVDCDTTYGTFHSSDTINAVNTALQLGESMDDYTFDGNTGRQIKFLTKQPDGMSVCIEDNLWLMCLVSVQAYYDDNEIDGTLQTLELVYNITDSVGTSSVTLPINPDQDGALVVAAGPANMGGLVASHDLYYEVKIRASVVVNSVTTNFDLTESKRFYLNAKCCASPIKQVYFLEQIGGFGGLKPDRVEFMEAEQSYQLHESPIDCDTEDTNKRIREGLSTNSHQAFRKAKLFFSFTRTEDNMVYMESFRASTKHYVNFQIGNKTTFDKFIVDPGSIKTKIDRSLIRFEVTGRFNLNIDTQK